MTDTPRTLWIALEPTPLLWLVITLGAYLAGRLIQRACRGSVVANPVLIAIVIVAMLLIATGTNYRTYFGGAQFIHFLLGPATVALAVPLANNIVHVRRSLSSIALAMVLGSVTSIVTGILLVRALGGGSVMALSMAPKSLTTPIAMAVAHEIGALPALTAALAILGGIITAIVGEPLLRAMRVADWRAHGLAAGITGGGIAAAQVATRDPLGAAFAALGIGLNGLLAALLIPILVRLLA